MEIIVGLISLISLIVFFVMANNIDTLVNLSRKQIDQNDEIIKRLSGDIGLSDADKAKLYDERMKAAAGAKSVAEYNYNLNEAKRLK